MKDKLEELLWVLYHSRSTRFCAWLGIVACIGLLIAGHVMTERIELQGALRSWVFSAKHAWPMHPRYKEAQVRQ